MHTSSRRIITVPLHLTDGKTRLLSLRRQGRKYIYIYIYINIHSTPDVNKFSLIRKNMVNSMLAMKDDNLSPLIGGRKAVLKNSSVARDTNCEACSHNPSEDVEWQTLSYWNDPCSICVGWNAGWPPWWPAGDSLKEGTTENQYEP